MTSQQKRLSLLLLIACILVLLLFLGARRATVPLDAQEQNAEANAVASAVNKSESIHNQVESSKHTDIVVKELDQAELDSLLNSLPTSLQDIPPPENLDINENNELLINLKIRRLFDFYLSALGEEDLDTLVQRISLSLELQLPEPALNQALIILEGYLQYKDEIDAVRVNSETLGSGEIEDIMLLKQKLRDSRSIFLSPEVAEAFFAEEDQYDDYQMQKTRILRDQALSSSGRELALANLKSNTPEWLLEQEYSAQKITQYRKQIKALKDRKASAAKISQFRAQQFGSDAAKRLSDLDQQRADWEQRLVMYRKTLLDAVKGLDVGSSEFIVVSDRIRAQHYSGHELIRINALDALYFAQ